MPCHLLVFPIIKVGIHSISITNNVTGTSTKSEAFIPFIIFDVGKLNGDIVIDNPDTRTTLKKFAPTMFPSDKLLCPLIIEVMAVDSSGKDVPSANIVIPITDSGTPNLCAIKVPFSTNTFDTYAIVAAHQI